MAREKVSAILAELGCEVITAVDGVEGLKVATQHADSLGLIVLDIQMPKADGITLLRYVRKLPQLESTPIVMLTTQADKETVSKALGFGANDFLRKDATITHITDRLSAHLDAVRESASGASHDSKKSRSDAVGKLVLGSRRAGEGKGSYVLCHVPRMELQDLCEVHGDRQREFYERLANGIDAMNKRYPKLELGYRIESDSQEVTRLLQGGESIPWVLLLGHRQEGISLARMTGFSQAAENRTIHIVCEASAALPESEKKSVTRMGAQVIEQSRFDGPGLMKLIEKHLLPPEQVLPNGVKIRELNRQTGTSPADGQVLTMYYSGARKDGTSVVDTFNADEPSAVEVGNESLPAGLWEALSRLGPGSRALIEVPADTPEEPVYFLVDMIDVD